MFCPNCGKPEQLENTYCRRCGEFLPDLTEIKKNRTPEGQFNLTVGLNLFSAIASVLMAILILLFMRENTHGIIIAATCLFFVISAIQFSTFINNMKLRKHFDKDRESTKKILESNKTNELLPEADLSDIVPMSVTENTTRKLKVENRKKSE